jgi:hypothetical protein
MINPIVTDDARPGPRRARAAAALESFALALLVAVPALAAGFWIADRGWRWMPDALELLLGLLALAFVLHLVGLRLRRAHSKARGEGSGGATPAQVRPRRLVLVLLAALLAVGGLRLAVHAAQSASPLTSIPRSRYEDAFSIDLVRYRAAAAGLAASRRALESALRPEPGPSGAADPGSVLSADAEHRVLDGWSAFLDHATQLEQVRIFHEDWWRFDPSRAERPYQLRSWLLTYASELALYEESVRVTRAFLDHPDAAKFVDAPHRERGLEAASLSRFRQDSEGTRDQARVLAGAQYLRWMDHVMRWRLDARALGLSPLWSEVEERIEQLASLGLLDRTQLMLRGDSQGLKRALRRAWMPAQTGVAAWIGDTKLRRIGWYLLTEEQFAEMDRELQPGDVLVGRKNWYLSNVGLPGFWPHGILYLGAPQKLAAWAEDEAVRGWVREASAGATDAFDAWMAGRFPSAWLRYQAGAPGGHAFVVMEAISEGVVLNTWEHAAGDSLAALRPRLDKRAVAQAIAAAFAQMDKPYDFDFDFATEHALVCTELLWRAFRPAEGKQGLDWALVDVAGRRTLPANEIVRAWASGESEGAAPMDFVLFYDADEKERRAVRADEGAFRESWGRGKWGMGR